LTVVLLSQDLFQPLRLAGGGFLAGVDGIVENDKFLAASLTAKSSHLLQVGRPFPRLTFLDRD
jgi:hypothetical protein